MGRGVGGQPIPPKASRFTKMIASHKCKGTIQAFSILHWAQDVSLLVSFQRSSTKAHEESEEQKQFRNIFRQIAGDVSMQSTPVSATKAAWP